MMTKEIPPGREIYQLKLQVIPELERVLLLRCFEDGAKEVAARLHEGEFQDWIQIYRHARRRA